MKRSAADVAIFGVAGLVLAYLLFPVLVVVLISFSSARFLAFPPPGFSLQWFEKVFGNWEWVSAFWVTLQVGGLTMAMATLLGVPAAFGLVRFAVFGKSMLNGLLLAALITPPIIKAISIYLFYVPLKLNNSILGLAFAHTLSGLPFVVVNTMASLRTFDANLERAAIIHGASPIRAVIGVTLPIIMPGIVVGALFAFMQSAQELLVATFVLGTVTKPLAVKLWEGVLVAVDPSIAAASTALVVLAILGFLSAAWVQKRTGSAGGLA